MAYSLGILLGLEVGSDVRGLDTQNIDFLLIVLVLSAYALPSH